MMSVISNVLEEVRQAFMSVFGHEIDERFLNLSPTKKEFEGDYTFVVFPMVKALKSAPDKIADQLGKELVSFSELIKEYNVVKGFLNLSLTDQFWYLCLDELRDDKFAKAEARNERIVVEFSSPNTNKPLHLGHIRNILLGWSVAQIAANRGYDVVKTQIINDRGIAICKSMMAWQMFGQGATPESTATKGDHFVGQYYVAFDRAIQEEYKEWQEIEGQELYKEKSKEGETMEDFFKRFKNQYFNEYSPLGRDTKKMLIKWEQGDEEVVALWRKMNGWVYEGFDVTYDNLGVEFDTINYESETYLLGKDAIAKGLESGIFYQMDDGSVWIDLEDAGMDKKLVLRSDGTSVYMTQDIGTAQMRYRLHKMDSMVYVVGDEQDYHFKVLFEILKRLNEPYADGLYHLSYGMVDLPTGKMKSREGTVVDADDLIKEVIGEARKASRERGAVAHLSEKEQEAIFEKIGLAALKYFIIKVNPKKRMVFDPQESVDMQGTTGPYIQNAYVRIQSILRKAQSSGHSSVEYRGKLAMGSQDKKILTLMLSYPEVLDEAIQNYDPSLVANFCYALAKSFHRYYHDNVILDDDNKYMSSYRLDFARCIAEILENAMALLGIEMPEYM
jgi:arginyl-tRNA synthetase